MKMNSSPYNYRYLKRFLDNKGDIEVPGFDPILGKKKAKQKLQLGKDGQLRINVKSSL